MQRQLFTIGYEGSSVDKFIETLVEAGVERVIDVRDVPASRKPGFSKSALAEHLARRGLRYDHLKALGDPKAGREAMRAGDHHRFLAIYGEHVTKPETVAAIKLAAELARDRPSALLCFERDPKHCHRTLVAGILSDVASFTIRHLGVPAGRVRTRERGTSDGQESAAVRHG